MGVGSHCHGHFPEQLKTFLPTNVGTADAMGRRFVREKRRFGVNSRAGRSQLSEVDFGSKEASASYREEDAAKTGHAVGSRGPGGGNEKRAHGQRRFMAGPACKVAIRSAPHMSCEVHAFLGDA